MFVELHIEMTLTSVAQGAPPMAKALGVGSWTSSTVNIVAHIIEWTKAKAHWVRAA